MSESVAEHRCATCGDVAVPMRVLAVDERRGLALCAAAAADVAAGACETVEVALVDRVAPDDWLLVHAGTALARVDTWETSRA